MVDRLHACRRLAELDEVDQLRALDRDQLGRVLLRLLRPPAERLDRLDRPLEPVLLHVPKIALHALPRLKRGAHELSRTIHHDGAVAQNARVAQQREEAERLEPLGVGGARVSQPLVDDRDDGSVSSVRGHRAAFGVAGRRVAGVHADVVRVAARDIALVRLGHRPLGLLRPDRLHLRLEAVVVGRARRAHAEERAEPREPAVRDGVADQAVVDLRVEHVVVAVHRLGGLEGGHVAVARARKRPGPAQSHLAGELLHVRKLAAALLAHGVVADPLRHLIALGESNLLRCQPLVAARGEALPPPGCDHPANPVTQHRTLQSRELGLRAPAALPRGSAGQLLDGRLARRIHRRLRVGLSGAAGAALDARQHRRERRVRALWRGLALRRGRPLFPLGNAAHEGQHLHEH
mmetsp:Transcript_40908/g.135508  ORF Transcript_40908/g.135508 Transcript_40908/m.135508 type:complete len:406 (+) Transcript_40908:188-1405(+)